MIFTLNDIKKDISPEAFLQGQIVFQQGQVTAPNIQRGGELITTVIHQTTQPIRVYVRTTCTNGVVSINGECNCSARHNCQHVAATLLQALQDQDALPADSIVDPLNSPKNEGGTTKPPQSLSKQVLLYILHRSPLEWSIETVAARHKDANHYLIGHHYEPRNATKGITARFITETDKQLLTQLEQLPRHPLTDFPALRHPNAAYLLQGIVNTGHCLLDDSSGPLIGPGESRPAHYLWNIDGYGTQTLVLTTPPNTEVIDLSPHPLYLDITTNQIGLLSLDLAPDIIYELKNVSPVLVLNINKAQTHLAKRITERTYPALQTFIIDEQPTVTPTICLKLITEKEDQWGFQDESTNYAVLSFDYAGISVSRDSPPYYHDSDNDHMQHISRDQKTETSAYQKLLQVDFYPADNIEIDDDRDRYVLSDKIEDWLDFQLDVIPTLRKAGWRIEVAHDFSARIVTPSQWYCETKTSDKLDWFDISIGVEIDGVKLDLLPTLLQFIRSHPRGLPSRLGNTEQFILEMADGGLLSISAARMQNLYHALLELYDNKAFSKDDTLSLRRIELARLAELSNDADGLRLAWISDNETQTLLNNLCEPDVITQITPPEGLKADLREYQRRGLDWLQFLSKFGLAGILADDMGLGKTIQALAHLLTEKEQGRANRPSLVIAPTSLIFNWRQEAARFAPSLKVLTLWGPTRHSHYVEISQHDLILTTYPLIVRDQDILLQHDFHLLILDEAQVIKNSKTQASRTIRNIKAKQRLCLTGTPLENHLGELWSLFDFLLPGLLGTNKQFQRFFRTPIEKNQNAATAERLRVRLRPFLLRRSKQQVAKDLPEKTEIIQTVSMDNAQRELYETVRLSMHRRVREEIERQGINRSHIVVLDALLKLRQVCCDPRLVKTDAAQKVKQSAKLEMLMQFLPEMIDEGRRILIFSQFTKMLSLIETELNDASISYVKLTGQTRDRQAVVEDFQAHKVPVFLISLKAGGVGLNLTAADTVIHYDPWWNPAVENQATDRAHRIGQKNPVFVYKFICENTVEEKIHSMQKQKQALADNLYEGSNGQLPQWTKQDLELLFNPSGQST